MRNLFSDGHEADALEEVCDRKQLTSHGAEGERFSIVVLAGFETGDDRRQLVLHQGKFFIPASHRVALALDVFEACDQGTKIDVVAVFVLAVHEEILSQKGIEAEMAGEQGSRGEAALVIFVAPLHPLSLSPVHPIHFFGRGGDAC